MRRPFAGLLAVVGLFATISIPASTPAPRVRTAGIQHDGLFSNERYGFSIGWDGGSWMAVGVPHGSGMQRESGVAFVYRMTLDNYYGPEGSLRATDGTTGSEFGASVAVCGDTAAVGARYAEGVGNSGAVYVFRRNNTTNTWFQSQKLVGDGSTGAGEFGASVACAGDALVVGAQLEGVMGRVYVFERPNSSADYAQAARFDADDGALFGAAVDIRDSRIAAGAPGAESLDAGYVRTFQRIDGVWTADATLVANDGAIDDKFGAAVELTVDGGGLLVGATHDDVGASIDQGSVYVFANDGSWTQTARVTAAGAAHFGATLASGPVPGAFAVGAPAASLEYLGGVVFIFGGPLTDPRLQVTAIRSPGGFAGEAFGSALAIAPEQERPLYVGMPFYFNPTLDCVGTVVEIDPYPLVTGVTPAHGLPAGGTAVTVTGAAFDPAHTSVTIGGQPVTPGDFSVDQTSFVFTTPAHDAGPVDVVVGRTDTGMDVMLAGIFTYVVPMEIAAITPAVGPPGAATPFTLTGTGFQDGVAVWFGASPATDIELVDETTLTGFTPQLAAGTVDVTVVNPDNQEDTLAAGYRYSDVDLQISRFLAPPGVGIDEAFDVSDTTKNLRPGGTPPTTTAFALRPVDARPTLPGRLGPVIPVGQRTVAAFSGRGVNPATTTVTVPAGTSPGLYNLVAMADADLALAERSEVNNTKQRRILVGGDLRPLPVRAPMAGTRGATITVTVRSKNFGPGTAPAGTITRLWLSTDALAGPGDTLVVEWTLGTIAPGETATRSHEWEVPGGLTPGRYYLVAEVDSDGIWEELNEYNNAKAKALTVR